MNTYLWTIFLLKIFQKIQRDLSSLNSFSFRILGPPKNYEFPISGKNGKHIQGYALKQLLLLNRVK